MEQEHQRHGGKHESRDHHHHHHEGPWKLNVQGVIIDSPEPTLPVREALKLAGFDPNAGWIIILKITGEPKKPVELTTVLDLRRPGIEKLRLTPKQIDNGEAIRPYRADFALLPQDEELLDRLGLVWETRFDGPRRWLILRAYPLPPGYTETAADIAVEVPVSYPGAQLDMFYCNPHLALKRGGSIPQTQCTQIVLGTGYQRWSRHRQWDSSRDTLATHLVLIDESVRREVEGYGA